MMNEFFKSIVDWGKKHAPEIAAIIGITAGAGAVACAVVETHKYLDDIVDNHNARLDEVKKIENEEENKKQTIKAYTKTGTELVKAYWPTIVLETVSVAAEIFSFRTMDSRNKSLVAAYSSLAASFAAYRGRIVDKYGPDADAEAMTKGKGQTVIDADTGELSVLDDQTILDTDCVQIFYDASAPYTFTKDVYTNRRIIRDTERVVNARLRQRGYVNANFFWEKMGMTPTLSSEHRYIIFDRTSDNRDNQFQVRLIRDGRYISDSEYIDSDVPEIILEINCNQSINDLKMAKLMPIK